MDRYACQCSRGGQESCWRRGWMRPRIVGGRGSLPDEAGGYASGIVAIVPGGGGRKVVLHAKHPVGMMVVGDDGHQQHPHAGQQAWHEAGNNSVWSERLHHHGVRDYYWSMVSRESRFILSSRKPILRWHSSISAFTWAMESSTVANSNMAWAACRSARVRWVV